MRGVHFIDKSSKISRSIPFYVVNLHLLVVKPDFIEVYKLQSEKSRMP